MYLVGHRQPGENHVLAAESALARHTQNSELQKYFKVFFIIWCSCIHHVCWARSKYNEDDEDNPYEFGFTIDGQQHRHEKKDANGIIQGEFGFITADGVYHVTVYATDEDGNFKILSMRNVKISGPLDEPNAKLPDTSKFGKESPRNPVAPSPNPLSINPSPPPLQAITSRPNGQFTTQSTIKPACAGCGYVTLKPPGSKNSDNTKLDFQTPAFQKPKPGTVIIGAELEEKSKSKAPAPVPSLPVPAPVPSLPIPAAVPSLPVSPTDRTPLFTSSVLQQKPNNYDNNDQYPNNYPQGNDNYQPSDAPFNNVPNLPDTPLIAANVNDQNLPNNHNPVPNGPIVQPFANPLAIPNSFTDTPPTGISVTNTAINVPNGPPIPIQDKYPNMKDGLPEGISKDDITGILYKFNYTVGFHGHYEKGYKSGAKVGGYFVTDRDGVSRIVTYVADENGYRPKVKFIRLDLNSDLVPKEGSEKKFGLKNFEFVWYPIQ